MSSFGLFRIEIYQSLSHCVPRAKSQEAVKSVVFFGTHSGYEILAPFYVIEALFSRVNSLTMPTVMGRRFWVFAHTLVLLQQICQSAMLYQTYYKSPDCSTSPYRIRGQVFKNSSCSQAVDLTLETLGVCDPQTGQSLMTGCISEDPDIFRDDAFYLPTGIFEGGERMFFVAPFSSSAQNCSMGGSILSYNLYRMDTCSPSETSGSYIFSPNGNTGTVNGIVFQNADCQVVNSNDLYSQGCFSHGTFRIFSVPPHSCAGNQLNFNPLSINATSTCILPSLMVFVNSSTITAQTASPIATLSATSTETSLPTTPRTLPLYLIVIMLIIGSIFIILLVAIFIFLMIRKCSGGQTTAGWEAERRGGMTNGENLKGG